MEPLKLEVWSDIACPWCYVGKRRLEGALERFAPGAEIRWRSFELNPASPREVDLSVSYAERLASKYRVPKAQADLMIARMTETAAADGLPFRFDIIRPGNTFDAHRLIHLAKDRGLQGEMKESFLRAYLCEGERIGDPETLARIAKDVGLDDDDIQSVLGTDAYAKDVRADEEEAGRIGIQGVPFFLVDRRFGVSGAQPVDTLLSVLERAARERTPEIIEGAFCGPDGC
ncbi:MAG: DsbA family oxidoreductase [Myxococcota bacterium]